VNSPTPFETTDTLYRFRELLPAGKTIALSVTEEIVEGETIAVLTSDIGQLEVYSRTGEIPKEVRDGLLKAMDLKSALVDTERQIKENQRQLQEIAQEQQRMRENMAAINSTSQYYTRLLTKLNDQETVIEKLHAAVERLKSDYARQRQELETYLSNTTIG
jgi:chromosome segregation ATPase